MTFWTSNAPALIALGGVLAGLIAGFFQWRGNLRQQRALEERAALVAALRHLKILDMSQPLDLENLYVQVRLREEEPPPYLRGLVSGGDAQGPAAVAAGADRGRCGGRAAPIHGLSHRGSMRAALGRHRRGGDHRRPVRDRRGHG
ncbi:hypothetical protein [Nonomuraea typhae]|uniref:hypothetical protein n=1 Tax=Nonomuraea typhae TaxID=2603600 RepID=UPI0012FB82C7|nr:hypothetical protein [Nonomuraea typhae]